MKRFKPREIPKGSNLLAEISKEVAQSLQNNADTLDPTTALIAFGVMTKIIKVNINADPATPQIPTALKAPSEKEKAQPPEELSKYGSRSFPGPKFFHRSG